MAAPSAGPAAGAGIMSTVAERLGRSSLILAAGSASVFPFSLMSVALLTRYLDPDGFGRLAVFFVFAGFLTIFMNLVFLNGTLMFVFGGGDEDAPMEQETAGITGTKINPKRALFTGAVLIVGLIAVTSTVAWVFAADIADHLLNQPEGVSEMRTAVASAATGSLWRLVSNVLRMERRFVAFAITAPLRPVFVLCATAPLVATGGGVQGALLGTTIGTAVAIAGVLFYTRRSYEPSFERAVVWPIARLGVRLVPMVVGLYAVHEADILVLANGIGPGHVTEEEIGLYRLASRLSSIVSYLTSAMLMAWVPLSRSALWAAAAKARGRSFDGTLVTYFLIGGLTLSLIMSLTADVMIDVLAPGFEGARDYVAASSIAYLSFGLLIIVFRVGTHKRKWLVRSVASVTAALLVVVIGAALVPSSGVWGGVIGSIVGPLSVATFVLWLGTRGASGLQVDWPRVSGCLALAVACWAVGHFLAPELDDLAWLARFATGFAFFGLLVLLDIVPKGHRRGLRVAVAGLLRPKEGAERLVRGVDDLPSRERQAVYGFCRDRLRAEAVGRRIGVDRALACEHLARGLRRLVAAGPPHRFDGQIGEMLTANLVGAEYDARSRELLADGFSPIELHAIEDAYTALSGLSARRWAAPHLDPVTPDYDTVAALPFAEREVLRQVVREGEHEDLDLAADAVAILRRLAGLPPAPSSDHLVAAFLFGRAVPSRQLWTAGVDPLDLVELETTAAAIAALPWPDDVVFAGSADEPEVLGRR